MQVFHFILRLYRSQQQLFFLFLSSFVLHFRVILQWPGFSTQYFKTYVVLDVERNRFSFRHIQLFLFLFVLLRLCATALGMRIGFLHGQSQGKCDAATAQRSGVLNNFMKIYYLRKKINNELQTRYIDMSKRGNYYCWRTTSRRHIQSIYICILTIRMVCIDHRANIYILRAQQMAVLWPHYFVQHAECPIAETKEHKPMNRKARDYKYIYVLLHRCEYSCSYRSLHVTMDEI